MAVAGNGAGTAGTPTTSVGGAPQGSAGRPANLGGFESIDVCLLSGRCSVEGATCTDHAQQPNPDQPQSQFTCCRESLTCTAGRYSNPAYDQCHDESCPSTLPVEGSACGQCARNCRYGACKPDGSGQNLDAYCDGHTWVLYDVACIACCQVDADCPGGMCAGNACEPLAHAGCFRDDECQAGQFCSGAQVCPCGDAGKCSHADRPGVCVPSGQACCKANSDCPDDGSCVAGVCKSPAAPGDCWTDAECPIGCSGPSLCPCGSSCLVADQPGKCIEPL